MIVEGVINVFFGILGFLLSLIPQPLVNLVGGVEGLVEVLSYASIFLPLDAMVSALYVWLALQSIDIAYQAAMWVWRKIPGES